MRNPLASMLMVTLIAGAALKAGAQCPTVTGISPTVVGRTINPASTYWNLNGDVADGSTITIDAGGANLVFEFDTNNSVGAGRIAVAIPAPPNNRDAARDALIAAVNAEPSAPCVVTSDFSSGFPQYLAVVWKGETNGYGAMNSSTGANIQVRNFSHQGNAQAFVLLTGTGLNQVSSVRLESTTTSDVLAGTNLYKPSDGLSLGFQVIVVPNGIDPNTDAPALGEYDIVLESGCGTETIPAGVTVVENLLNDATFSMHFLGNTNYNGCGGLGAWDVWPGPLWQHNNTPGAPISQWDVRDKASLYTVSCQREDPWPVNDYIWGSITNDRAGRHEFWQVVPVNFTEQTTVTIRGMYAGGTSAPIAFGVELYDQNDTLQVQDGPHSESDWIDATPPNSFWADFTATGDFPAGTTEIKAVFYLDIQTDWVGAALHIDDLLLFEGELCPNSPSINSVSPNYGVRDDTAATITVFGTNFAAGDTTVKLYRNAIEVSPVSVAVASDTELTATFDLTGLARDYWGVSVQNPDCPLAALPSAFNVVLAGPGLTNGSFELPEYTRPDPCQYGTRTDGLPEDWTSIHITPYSGGSHYRDDLVNHSLFHVPTCLPPDGLHWASVSAPADSYAGMRRLTQTVTVTPGSTYTLSGFFAAGGPNNLSISLLDGGHQAETIARQTVLAGGDHDWTFGYVSGTATGNLITAVWDTDNDAQGQKVGHADDLVLEECTAAVELISVTPTTAASEQLLAGAVITGSGFSGDAVPFVALVRDGMTIPASDIVVADDGTLTCDFDLTGAGFGSLNLVVGNNGCYALLVDALFTAPADILNAEFEDPTILDDSVPPGPAAPCLGAVQGTVDGWKISDPAKFVRDGTTHADVLTCPNPNAAGGHYASLSTDQVEALQVYQTLKVTPGRNYVVSGWFAGGGSASVALKLVDGIDPSGAVLASVTVMETTGFEQTDWQLGTVQGSPAEEMMTIVWELTGTGGMATSHADGFLLASPCHSPFADADEDGDVDQDDFAVFQLCYTGPDGAGIPTDPAYCACFNTEGADDDIDQADLSVFENCASGPHVPADPGCAD